MPTNATDTGKERQRGTRVLRVSVAPEPFWYLRDEHHEDALRLGVQAHEAADKDLLALALHRARQQEQYQLLQVAGRRLFGDQHQVGQLGRVDDLVEIRLVEPLDVTQQPVGKTSAEEDKRGRTSTEDKRGRTSTEEDKREGKHGGGQAHTARQHRKQVSAR